MHEHVIGKTMEVEWKMGITSHFYFSKDHVEHGDITNGALQNVSSYVIIPITGRAFWMNYESPQGHTNSFLFDFENYTVKSVWTKEEGGENTEPSFASGKFRFI